MKKSEVKNIVTDKSLDESLEPKLIFTKMIDHKVGEIQIEGEDNCCQPEDWNNVRHLTGNLYLAWDDFGNYTNGNVYVGEFR